MTQRFKPGEIVPDSGVYWVIHKEHRPAHLNELRAAETFPHCKQCKDEVRFELLSDANYRIKSPTQ
ncbi:MAG TPA: hypothetical protein VFB76_15905 [Candidatus Angelobacter sp.]|nr:hypothetical protein [Candidatus Angelobacter sp.]